MSGKQLQLKNMKPRICAGLRGPNSTRSCLTELFPARDALQFRVHPRLSAAKELFF